MFTPRHWRFVRLCLLLALPLAACGRIAPRFAPVAVDRTGTLIVTSAPAGAAVQLDGVATGRVTPDTLTGVIAGPHVVRVALGGWRVAPDSIEVTVVAQSVAQASFTLTLVPPPPPQVVLIEAFSNVNCVGCPAMATMLASLMAEAGHGLDRVVLVKYAANWPAVNDPHYVANSAANNARMTFYQSYLMVGIPTLVVNGALAGSSGTPPSLAATRDLVDAQLQHDPGLAIEVQASALASGTGVTATATLRADRAVAHANTVLRFALVQDPVTYATPPGNQGETTFHDVMRDVVTAADAPLPLGAGATFARTVTLARQAAWPVANLHVVAFVQDTQTREVLQAAQVLVSPSAARAIAAPRPSLSPAAPVRTRTAPALSFPTLPPSPPSRHPNDRGRP